MPAKKNKINNEPISNNSTETSRIASVNQSPILVPKEDNTNKANVAIPEQAQPKTPQTNSSTPPSSSALAHLSPDERQRLQAQFANFSFTNVFGESSDVAAGGQVIFPPQALVLVNNKNNNSNNLESKHSSTPSALQSSSVPNSGPSFNRNASVGKTPHFEKDNTINNQQDHEQRQHQSSKKSDVEDGSNMLHANSRGMLSNTSMASGGSLNRFASGREDNYYYNLRNSNTNNINNEVNGLSFHRHHSRQQHQYYDNASFSRSHLLQQFQQQNNSNNNNRSKSSPNSPASMGPNLNRAGSNNNNHNNSPTLTTQQQQQQQQKSSSLKNNFISWNGLYACHQIDFWKLGQVQYDFEGVTSLSRTLAVETQKKQNTKNNNNNGNNSKQQKEEAAAASDSDPFSALFHQGGPAPAPADGLAVKEFRDGDATLVMSSGADDSFMGNDTIAMFECDVLVSGGDGGGYEDDDQTGIRSLLKGQSPIVSNSKKGNNNNNNNQEKNGDDVTKNQNREYSKAAALAREVATLTRGLHTTINNLEIETKKRFWLFKHTKNHGVEMLTFTHASDLIAYFLDVLPELTSSWGAPTAAAAASAMMNQKQKQKNYFSQQQQNIFVVPPKAAIERGKVLPSSVSPSPSATSSPNLLGKIAPELNTSASFGVLVDQDTFTMTTASQSNNNNNNNNNNFDSKKSVPKMTNEPISSTNFMLPDGSNPSNVTLAGSSENDHQYNHQISNASLISNNQKNNNEMSRNFTFNNNNNSLTSPGDNDHLNHNHQLETMLSNNNNDNNNQQQQMPSSSSHQYQHHDGKDHDDADRSSHSSSTVATTANLGDSTYWLDIQTGDYDTLLEVLKLFPSIRKETFDSFKNSSDRHSMRHFSHHGYLACVFTGPTHLQYKEVNDYVVLDDDFDGDNIHADRENGSADEKRHHRRRRGQEMMTGAENEGGDDEEMMMMVDEAGKQVMMSKQTRRLNDAKLLQLPRRNKMCCILSKHLCITFHTEPMKGLGSVIKRLHMQFRPHLSNLDGLSTKQRENLDGMMPGESSSDDEQGDDEDHDNVQKSKAKAKKERTEVKSREPPSPSAPTLMMTPGWVFSMLYQQCVQFILPDVSTLTAVIESMDARILLQSAEGALDVDDTKRGGASSSSGSSSSGSASRNPLIVRVARFRRGLAEHRANLSRKEHLSSLLISPKMSVCSYLNCIGTQQRFHDIIPTVQRSLQQLDSLREILTQCNSNLMAQISIAQANSSNKMAAQMTQLSVIATITMPLGILLGAFGTNVPVPFQSTDSNSSLTPFFVILGGMVAWVVGVLSVLHFINRYNNNNNNSKKG